MRDLIIILARGCLIHKKVIYSYTLKNMAIHFRQNLNYIVIIKTHTVSPFRSDY